MRDVRQAAGRGDDAARLALDVTVHRLKHYIGAYTALLGRLDVLTFTAGVGENDAALRAEVLSGLEVLGIRLDPERNASPSRDARVISADDSAVTVLVVPTNEELEISRQSLEAVRAATGG
jgi:acetate kinase